MRAQRLMFVLTLRKFRRILLYNFRNLEWAILFVNFTGITLQKRA
jgi:hypothetical protein